MPTQTINLNNTTPAAPADALNIGWQADPPSLDPTVIRSVSAFVPAATAADLGVVKPDGVTVDVDVSGEISVPAATTSLKGLVKPDGVGILVDGAGNIITQMIVGFMLSSGATGNTITPPGRLIAPRAGIVTKCKVIVNAADGGIALTFRIKQNGTDVFTGDPTIPAGSAAGTLFTFTNLTSSPLAIAADDIFTIDITAGSSSWAFTAQLE
jgi:hypothetical protein